MECLQSSALPFQPSRGFNGARLAVSGHLQINPAIHPQHLLHRTSRYTTQQHVPSFCWHTMLQKVNNGLQHTSKTLCEFLVLLRLQDPTSSRRLRLAPLGNNKSPSHVLKATCPFSVQMGFFRAFLWFL